MALSGWFYVSDVSPERETPKCACAQDHVQTTRVWRGGTLWVCICKASLAKACANICTKCFRWIPQNDLSPVTRTEFEGAGRRFSEEIDQKGAIEDDRTCCMCVCVCVHPAFQSISFKSLCESIYLQTYVFQTKLPGLFGGKFHLFHLRMWTSFCLVIWYALVMIFFKVDLSILLFACEASWNLWKPFCFWYHIPILTPWLRITVIWSKEV